MAFERIKVGRPEAPERSEPGIDLHERLGPDPIDAPLGFDARLHEASLAQHAEVLGDRSLRHPQPALDLADGSLRRRQQAEDGPTVWLRDDRERGFHGPYMLTHSYSCQVTYENPTGWIGGIVRPCPDSRRAERDSTPPFLSFA